MIASDRPTALDGGAEETARYAPGDAAAFLAALAAELGDGSGARRPARRPTRERLAGELRPRQDRWSSGASGSAAARTAPRRSRSLLDCAEALKCSADDRRRFSVPDGANARGLARGRLPARRRPRLRRRPTPGRDLDADQAGPARRRARRRHPRCTPTRSATSPTAPAGPRRCNQARTVLAISTFDDASTKAADIVLPAEAYAEKEGTVTHPDGRLQRLRPAVPRPGEVRPIWQVLAELAAAPRPRDRHRLRPEALDAIAAEVPFYAGLTPEEIGGTGIRWQERDAGVEASDGRGRRGRPDAPRSTRRGRTAPRTPPTTALVAARDLPRPLGGRDHGAQRGAAGSWRPSRRSSSRRRTPSGSGSRRRRGRRALERHRASGARVALRERIRPGAGVPDRGHRRDNANALNGAETVEIDEAMIPLADVSFAEATWIMVVKSIVIFLGRVRDRPGADRGRAQADRPLPAPLRPQPGRPARD